MKAQRVVLLLVFLFLLLLPVLVVADWESLDVQTCTGGTSCSPAGLNSDDTSQDGATFSKGVTITTSWSTTSFDSASSIGAVTLILTKGGDSGITGNLDLTLRNAAATTTYCTFSTPNVQTDTKVSIPTSASCAWTKARLDDLVITVYNGDTKSPSNAYLSFMDLNITYTPPDRTAPTVSANSPGTDTWDLDGNVTFVYTPHDETALANCSLYLDGTYNRSNSSPLTDGSQNSFLLGGIPDGTHSWWVNCSDTAGNTNKTSTRTVKIDTTPPTVNLELPPNNNVTTDNDVTFFFNASDAQTTLDSCALIIDGSVKDTKSSPAEETSLSFSISLINAFYTWWINCTDANGFTDESEHRNLTVNGVLPTIAPGAGTYLLGQTAIISGENFNPSVGVTINYTLANNTVISKTNTTTGSGTFTSFLFLPYAYPNGTYNVFAYQTDDLAENASTSFEVNLPPTSATVTSSVLQGDSLSVTGTGFSPSSTINLTILFSDLSNVSFTAQSDANGDLASAYNLSYTVSIGLANLTAFDTAYPKLEAWDTFTVGARVAQVTTDALTYLRDEQVNIYGNNFTRLGIVQLAIYDDDDNLTASSYPRNKSTDDTGYFAQAWNTNSWCNGRYRVEALDQNNSFLNDTTYFEIDETTVNSDDSLIIGGYKQVGTGTQTALDVSLVNTSNDQDESLSSNTKTNYYYIFNFTNTYNRGLAIDTVTAVVEHSETVGFTTLTLEYWTGSQWIGTGCSFTQQSTPDIVEGCDLSPFYQTPESLDVVTLRFNLLKTGGGTDTSTVDYAHLEINTSYQPSCTYFNGSTGGGLAANPPFVHFVLLDDGLSAPPHELDLTAGTTKRISCNVSVSDGDGYGTITNVNATLYSDTVNASSTDDALNHYTNTSCSLLSGSGNNATFVCDFDVWYYARNGSWTCEAHATDGTDTSMASDNSTMNLLYALNISTTLIDYGSLAEGETSSEYAVNVTNYGNTPINLSLMGYGAAIGDGLSFNCAQENVSVANERYSFSSLPYASKTLLGSSFVTTSLRIPPTTDGIPSLNTTYWQLSLPGSDVDNPFGQCNGTIIFQAEAGS